MRRSAFSLVELVVVIVILGIIAATALPRFVDLATEAEEKVIASNVRAMISAQALFFSKALIVGEAYDGPTGVPLESFLQCDRNATLQPGQGADWQGNYFGLAALRESVFANPDAYVCNGDQVQFESRSGRTITITRTAGGIVWSASPSY